MNKPMNVDQMLQELTAIALLGTERRTYAGVNAQPGADPLVAGLAHISSSSSTETALVLSASLLSLYRRTGRVSDQGAWPESTAAQYQPAPDDRTGPSSAATQILDLLLSGTVAVAGQDDALLQQWFEGCVRHGHRLEHRQLVDALEWARKRSGLRPFVANALGARGLLLAKANPAWKWALAHDQRGEDPTTSAIDFDSFTSANSEVRRSFLTAWRQQDPAAARDVLVKAWAQENAADRQAFLRVLRIGLSADDEAFLESILDDRAKSVRNEAAEVLSRLPTSDWLARTQARINAVATVKGVRKTIEFALPEESDFDVNGIRDGFSPYPTKDPPQNIGPKAWIVRELASLAPLHCWEVATGKEPHELFAAANESPLRAELLESWSRKAAKPMDDNATLPAKQSHQAWVRELLHLPENRLLVSHLPEAERVRSVLTTIKNGPAFRDFVTSVTISQLRPNTELLSALSKRIALEPDDWVTADEFTPEWFFDASPELLEQLAERAPGIQNNVRHLQAAHSLRNAITKEFP